MDRRTVTLGLIAALACALPAAALSPGTDILVPAAARGAGAGTSTWVTDLCLFNPGSVAVTGTVAWLVRNQANPAPQTISFTLLPGETLCLDDVILNRFGLSSGGGAFRIQASGEVVATSRIYNLQDGVTFGQGFEGVLRSAAVSAGGTTDVVGLTNNASFRSNIVLMDASGTGSTVALSLRDAAGTELGSATVGLQAFEPQLFNVTNLGVGTFDVGTLHASVTAGSAIVVGSKIDNDPDTGDPTTLAPALPAGAGGSVNGTYHFAAYDSFNYASGGNLVVSGGELVALNGTFVNWDKVDAQQEPVCTVIFPFGFGLPPSVTLEALASTQGVEWVDEYENADLIPIGQITYTLRAVFSGGTFVSGTIDAVGADFEGSDEGCNGTFPPLTLLGGKSN